MAHKGLWEQLNKLDRQRTAQRAKCQYLTDPQRYIITLLNTEYVVKPAESQIFSTGTGGSRTAPTSSPTPAEFLEQLCLLAYLINAQDIPPANKFVGPENLPSGQFYFRGPHSLPTERLEETFGKWPERLYEVSERFGAKRCEFGDASIELSALPRVRLKIVIWRSDEEFGARASILFDQTAGIHLPLDALGALVNLTVKALVKAAE
ncbi:MAG TPA: DUF3786 domain-containing protein [Planctomycetes bacterium]|nr:DUF3786 domain-containing protein [Planctomycetota bacterium]